MADDLTMENMQDMHQDYVSVAVRPGGNGQKRFKISNAAGDWLAVDDIRDPLVSVFVSESVRYELSFAACLVLSVPPEDYH